MSTILQDLRFGIRVVRTNRGFTVVAVLTLALGIAANATVFSWIDALLTRPFPGASNSADLAVFESVTPGAPNGGTMVSFLDYCDYRDQLKSLSGLAVHREDVFSLGDAEGIQAVWGELVSGNYFALLGVKPALGRVFTPEEQGDKAGAYPVAVLSDRLWRSRFAANPAVIGTTVRINGHELTIVGVAPPEFRGTMPGLIFDIWVPVTMGAELGMADESMFRRRGSRNLYAVARLAPGRTVEQAGAEAALLAGNLASANPGTNRGVSATVRPVWAFHGAAPELLLAPLRILMAIAVLVLLIVCANVANLLLARSIGRQKELSIRRAVGATPWRLIRQMFTEVLILASAGALAGLVLSFWLADSLPGLIPQVGFSVISGFQLNIRVLAFTTLLCLMAALLSGIAPALFAFRADVNEALREGGRGGGSGVQPHRARSVLVICEVALAAVALIGAGLFVRSFHNARNIDPGFDRSHVLLARFYLAGAGYSPSGVQQFCVRLRERLQSLPGVSDITYSDFAPLGSSAGPYTAAQPEGYVPGPAEQINVNRYLIAPGYFRTLRIPVLEGRDFTENDDANAPPAIIVNQSFARRYFDGTNPVGRRVQCWGQWATVIGLVKDSKYFNVAEAPRPHFFASFRQRYRPAGQQLYFFIRIAGDPVPAIAALRREVASIDPNAGAFHAMPFTEWTDVTLLPQKVAASLLGALGVIALLLAAIGLYSVMAYAVAQRTHEIGVRMALGARPRDVLGAVLLRGMRLTLAGLVAGIALALAAGRLVSSLLVQVGAADLVTFTVVSLFLAGVALLASFVPARRATRVDPITALRCE